MPNDVNMDNKGNPNATVPVMEFTIPLSEVDADVAVGEKGVLMVPCEVISKTASTLTFRKSGPVTAEGEFRPETTSEMRTRLLEEQDKAETPQNEE